MRLRILGFALLAALLAAEAAGQAPTTKIHRIGHLGHGLEPSLVEAFRKSLNELGHVEGRSIEFEYRYTEGSVQHLPGLATELVRLKPDVIVANGTPAARAAQQATSEIPVVIVGIGGDPVRLGLVRSLSRPGGNLTGIAALGTELWGKRLELFREAFPGLARIVVLANTTNPGNVLALKEIGAVAPQAGVKVQTVAARDATELGRAFAEIRKDSPDAMIVIWDAFLQSNAKRITDFAIQQQIPTLAPVREYVHAGALMSYGANIPDQWRRAAQYVDKLLRGAKPADLPVEQPTKFDLAINLRTAKALGVKLPSALLLRADDVIH